MKKFLLLVKLLSAHFALLACAKKQTNSQDKSIKTTTQNNETLKLGVVQSNVNPQLYCVVQENENTHAQILLTPNGGLALSELRDALKTSGYLELFATNVIAAVAGASTAFAISLQHSRNIDMIILSPFVGAAAGMASADVFLGAYNSEDAQTIALMAATSLSPVPFSSWAVERTIRGSRLDALKGKSDVVVSEEKFNKFVKAISEKKPPAQQVLNNFEKSVTQKTPNTIGSCNGILKEPSANSNAK